ncbi:MAG: hypothetical protein Q9187_003329 [Circinaria calcarea]
MPASLFAPSNSKPGQGVVHLTLLPPATPTFSTLAYAYPLKLLPSAPHILGPVNSPSSTSASTNTTSHTPLRPTLVPLLFLLSYGGGLLPPDVLSLKVTLSPSTRLVVTTQGSTKIFPPPPSLPQSSASQYLHAHISAHAALWLAPDPAQPFRGSRYSQRQVFEVDANGGSVGVVDWVCEGRRARGESWRDVGGWRGGNEVWRVRKDDDGRKLVVRDNVVLEGDDIGGRMEGVGVFGTILLMGRLFESLGGFFLEEFNALPRIGGRDWGDIKAGEVSGREKRRKERWKAEKEDGVWWTTASVRGCVLIKFGAREVEGARKWLRWMLIEEGSIGREFGDGGLMFAK